MSDGIIKPAYIGKEMARNNNIGGYIVALDGLRALAITLVFIFHLNESWLSGGFVGVDVFFVISGFIISRSILIDMDRGSFRFAKFYTRRVARLLPSVLVTFIASIIAASFVYGDNQLQALIKAGLFSVVSLVNVYFYLTSGYFDDASQSNIFLHNWSLSVEEQFYLVWPFMLLVFCKYARNALSTAIIATASFTALSYLIFLKEPDAAFYLMPMRVFQFAFGAIIALIALHHRTFIPSRTALQVCSLISGVGLIIAAAIFSSGEHYSFILAALLPTVGTAFVLLVIDAPVTVQSFGALPLRLIGLRAYVFYLVHWPIIVITRIFFPLDSFSYLVIVIGLMTISGELLHRFVEKKFRITEKPDGDGITKTTNAQYKLASVAALAVLSVGGAIILMTSPETSLLARTAPRTNDLTIAQSPIDARSLSTSYTRYAGFQWQARTEFGLTRTCQPQTDDSFESFVQDVCTPYRKQQDGVLILGDSYTAEARIMVAQFIESERLLQVGAAGCRPIYADPDRAKRSELCNDINDFRFQLAARDDIEAIFLVSNWRGWRKSWLRSTLDYLRSLEKPVYILGARPVFIERVPTLLDSAAGATFKLDLSSQLAFDVEATALMLDEVVRSYNGDIVLLDLFQTHCPDGCPAFTPDGAMFYLDTAHITASAAAYVGRQISKRYASELAWLFGSEVSARGREIPAMLDRAAVNFVCPANEKLSAIQIQFYAEFDGTHLKNAERTPKSTVDELWSGVVTETGVLQIEGMLAHADADAKPVDITLSPQGAEFLGTGKIGSRVCDALVLRF